MKIEQVTVQLVLKQVKAEKLKLKHFLSYTLVKVILITLMAVQSKHLDNVQKVSTGLTV
ncbi:MAG TPA: hypothetical protein V6D15_12530 [Oculatellaceae cyanobacterium]